MTGTQVSALRCAEYDKQIHKLLWISTQQGYQTLHINYIPIIHLRSWESTFPWHSVSL